MHPLNIKHEFCLFYNLLFLHCSDFLITDSESVHTAVFTPACKHRATSQRPLNFGGKCIFSVRVFFCCCCSLCDFVVWWLEKQGSSEWSWGQWSSTYCMTLVLYYELDCDCLFYLWLVASSYSVRFSFSPVWMCLQHLEEGSKINSTILEPPSSTSHP